MNFSSLKEYFYKLYNASILTMLLPMGLFLTIYYFSLSGLISPFVEDESMTTIILIVCPTVTLTILTIVHLVTRKRFKINAEVVGLGKKLDLFYLTYQLKMKTASWISTLLAICFFVTGHEWFSIYFSVIMLWFALQWPSPRKVSNQLKLKRDEREMVMTKGEAFRF